MSTAIEYNLQRIRSKHTHTHIKCETVLTAKDTIDAIFAATCASIYFHAFRFLVWAEKWKATWLFILNETNRVILVKALQVFFFCPCNGQNFNCVLCKRCMGTISKWKWLRASGETTRKQEISWRVCNVCLRQVWSVCLFNNCIR